MPTMGALGYTNRMFRKSILLLFLLTGCEQILGISDPKPAPTVDAGVDAAR